MIFGMDEAQLQSFVERISATAIANQAAIKCLVHGIPVTPDNVILFVGDFVDPDRPEFSGLIESIFRAIDEMIPLHARRSMNAWI